MIVYRHVLVGAFLMLVVAAPARAQQVTNEFFESKIRPVLAAKCYACHNSKMKEPKGYLTLDSREGVMKGGTLGPALVPGKPADSKLIHAMKYADPHLQMPPSGKLADDVIADFEAWIAGGAPDPRAEATAAATAKRRVVDEAELAKGRQWWAFQAVNVLPQPVSAHAAAARTKLDHFVLAKLAEKGLTPSPPADDRTLIRRAYIDLIGLKPTYDEVEAYASDASPDKYEKLLDKLLAMPQYGERWGRHWLDVVRYGEDNPGNITNPPYPHAWRYRDWVIEALNKDVPYDRFVKLQLAADLDAGHIAPGLARARPYRPRLAGSQGRAPVDRRHRHAAIERLGRAARYRHPRPARLVGLVRALPRSQVRSDPADGLREADQRVRVDVARAASVLRDRSEDRNALHVDLSADVRSALHRQPARRRSGIEARAGGATGEEVPAGARGAAGRDRRDVEGVPADCRVHQDGSVSGREAAGTAQSRRHVEEARAGARRQTRAAGRSDTESGARPESGRRRRPAQADRPAGAVPEFDLRRRRLVEHVRVRPHVLRRHAGQTARSAAVPRRQPRDADRSRAARVPHRARQGRRRLQERIRAAGAGRENLHRRGAVERARDGESRVGMAFRQTSRRHAQRLRHPGTAADASGAARGSLGAGSSRAAGR